MSEKEIKAQAIKAANSLDLMSAMGRNRAERRQLGKLNGVKIAGSSTPYVNKQKENKNR